MRILRIHHTLPALLLIGSSYLAGQAHAAAGPDFQYVGQDDRVHGLTAPRGCVEAEGGGTRAVTNRTRGTATLYQGAHCSGRVVGVLRAGEVTQVRPYFASVAFPVTG
ncbi:hypothetical protein ACN6AT_03120 [Streptomyces sp. JL4002]|uniref:hypothetical protein n=1 Tax=Streptomyces TaxID=1883 RepID=UPI0005E28F42|nr:hypothetical protein SF23_14815 [Streptomyces sp. MBRL 10]